MNILLVCEDLPEHTRIGGLGRHVVALGNALILRGHSVSLLGKDYPDYGDCVAEVGFNGRFVPGIEIPIKGWKEHQLGFFNPWKRPHFAKKLARAILTISNDYDVVHYHGHQPMVGSYIPKEVNFIQTRHDQGGDCIIDLRFKDGDMCSEREPSACARCIHPKPGIVRTAISTAAVRRYRNQTVKAYQRHPVIFVSKFLLNNFLKVMPNSKLQKATVVHNFFDDSEIAKVLSVVPAGLATGDTRIHIAGRLDDAKGIGPLLELLAPRLPPNWSVHICGDGPLRREMELKYGSSQVLFLGHKSHTETLLAAADSNACVVPSLSEEAFGLVTLEALRLGKPCFALARGGTPELVKYAGAGQLQVFESLSGLVDALLATTGFKKYVGGEDADVVSYIDVLIELYKSKMI